MTEFLFLRLIHILGGIFWVGGGLYSTIFIVPALAKAGPAAGAIMGELQRRRLFTVLPTVAVLTILSGIRMIWISSNGFEGHYFHTMFGHLITVGGGLGIVGFVFAMFYVRPASVKMGMLAAQLGSAAPEAKAGIEAELDSIRKKSSVGTIIAMGALTLSAAIMAVARYV